MTRPGKFAACLVVLALASACASDAVVFVTATNLGVEISAGEGNQGAKVGYQRNEFVSMPLVERDADDDASDDADDQGSEVIEAYPVVAMFELSTGDLAGDEGSLRVRQTFATGKAARGRTATAAVGAAFDAAGGGSGNRIPTKPSIAVVASILEAAGGGAEPDDRVLWEVSQHLLDGYELDAESLAEYVRGRELTAAEREQQLRLIPTRPWTQLRRLLALAAQDGRVDDLDAILAHVRTDPDEHAFEQLAPPADGDVAIPVAAGDGGDTEAIVEDTP